MTHERGSVTAEFAVALPAVLLLLALLLGVVRVGALQLTAQDLAADASRSLGRGEAEGSVRALVQARLPGADWVIDRRDGMVCAEISVPVAGPAAVLGLVATGRACALDGGR